MAHLKGASEPHDVGRRIGALDAVEAIARRIVEELVKAGDGHH